MKRAFLAVGAKLLREHPISRYRFGDKIPSYILAALPESQTNRHKKARTKRAF
jgi:hypothetical protein